VRNLLASQHVGSAGLKAIVWCLAITAASYLWARYLYNRRPVQ
jgi:ABC-2 type transport system permease protein